MRFTKENNYYSIKNIKKKEFTTFWQLNQQKNS